VRTAICRGVFGNEGGVGCRLVESTVVGQDCSYREQKSLLSEQKTARRLIYRGLEFLDMGRVGGVVLSVSCRAKSLHLSGMKDDFVWAVTRKRLLPMCLENAFPVIHFSKFSGGGPVQWASRLTALAGGKFCRESMPVPPNQFHPVRLYLHVA